MNIYLLEQSVNRDYDVFRECVVYAPTEHAARLMHPCEYITYEHDGTGWVDIDFLGTDYHRYDNTWANPEDVKVTYLGSNPEVTESKVICSDFNAG